MPLRPSVLLLLPLLGLTQCIMQGEEAYPQHPMPDATQTGANTAGCFVDGTLWVAHEDDDSAIGVPRSKVEPVRAQWNNARAGQPSHLALSLDKYINNRAQVHHDTYIKLELPGITRPGNFALDQAATPHTVNGPTAYASFTFHQPSPHLELLTGPGSPGRVVVTRFDTLSRVVSGTLEFTASAATGGRSVRVTEDRFDCTF